MTLVPAGCSGTRKVAEKVPLELDWVVVMVLCVPKEMEIDLFKLKPDPSTVTEIPANPDAGATEILGPVNVPKR